MEQREKTREFDHLKYVRKAACELALTRQETDAWIDATITEVEKAMEERVENA